MRQGDMRKEGHVAQEAVNIRYSDTQHWETVQAGGFRSRDHRSVTTTSLSGDGGEHGEWWLATSLAGTVLPGHIFYPAPAMNDDPASIWGDAEPVVVKQEATKGDLAAEELVPAPTTSAATSNLAPTKSLSLDDIDAGWGVPSPTVTPAKEKNGLDDSFKQLDLAASEAGEETVTLEVEQSDAVVSEPETLLGAATASSELDNSAPEAQPSVQEPESSSSVLAAAPETKEEAKEETLDFPEESPASPEALPEAAPAPADEPAPAPSTSEPTSKEDDSFPDGDDGFDDFGAVQEGGGGDDDFGDFGDFDEGAAEGFEGAEDFDTEDAASPVNGVTAGVQEKAREVPVLAEAKPWVSSMFIISNTSPSSYRFNYDPAYSTVYR